MAKNHEQKKSGPVPHRVISDRGVHLEQRNNLADHSNINDGMPSFSFLDPNGKSIVVKVGQKCPVCNKQVRGLNHESGDHHKGINAKPKSRY